MKNIWQRWHMDKQRILTLIDGLDSYLKELEHHRPKSFKIYEQNIEKRRFCERTLQLAIEVCIDISKLIIKDLKLGLPPEEEYLFDKLHQEKIISLELKHILQAMKRFRNVLIHRYVEIDDEIVFRNATKNIHDFKKFKQEILHTLNEVK